MKKKHGNREPESMIVDQTILDTAKAALLTDQAQSTARKKCVICSADAAPNSNENLCWVCRRLKISAWRDSDQQMNAQE